MEEELYDVVIYELATRVVDTIIGERLRLDEGFYNARRRQATGMERVNDEFSVAIVQAGSIKPGETLDDMHSVGW